MIKILLITTGAVLLAASGLQAAPHGAAFGGGIHAAPAGAGARAQFRPAGNYSRAYRGGYYRGGYYGGYRQRYYFLGGVPYFYDPFFFGFGYGYYGGFYGDPAGFGPYGYGYGGAGGAGGAYDGRVADDHNHNGGDTPDPSALPKEVQRQLSKRGYYKGSIDGEFGPGTKSALSRFQQDNKLRATGRVDGSTLKALGFEDRGGSDQGEGR